MTNPFPVLLDLGDGREPIPCRDERQADLLRGIWYAWITTHQQREAERRQKRRRTLREVTAETFPPFPPISPTRTEKGR